MVKPSFLIALIVALASCKSEAETSPPEKAPTAETTSWEKDQTKDCPTHVRSASTALEEIEGGYAVTVTSKDAHDAKTILEHATYVAGASKHSKPPEDALVFGGNTRNRNNNCPVILAATTVTATQVDGGARLEVRPLDPANLGALRDKAREKLATLQALRKALDEAMRE